LSYASAQGLALW